VAVQIGSVEVITSLEGALDLEPEWDALAAAHGRTPFALPALALAWWRHLGSGELLVVAVRGRSGELLAVGPFHRRRLAGLRVARWLGTGLGSVAELVCRPGAEVAADAVWQVLPEHVQVLDLLECRDDGAGLMELRRSDQWVTGLRVVDLCLVLDLSEAETIDDVLAGRSIRKKLNRYDRALEAAGGSFRVEVVTDRAAFHRVLAEVTEIYDEAERANPRQHLLADRWRPFVIEALDTAADRGQLVAFVGRLDERAVAFDLALRVGDTLCDWVGRYRPSVASLSVGHLMCREIVGWALAQDIARLDLLLGDHDYKRRWTNSHYDTIDVDGARPGWSAPARWLLQGVRAVHPLQRVAREGARRLRSSGGGARDERC
jgi:CelD/BcsL family acetyltransferase involved in cellulose biosynthesis